MEEPLLDENLNNIPVYSKNLDNSFLMGTNDPYHPTTTPDNYSDIQLDTDTKLDTNTKLDTDTKNQVDTSIQLACDITLNRGTSLISSVSTDWKNTILLFVIITALLPIYSLAIVLHNCKMYPSRISKKMAIIIASCCTSLYILIWVFIGTWVKYSNNSWSELFFILSFYMICCLAESILKTTGLQDHGVGQRFDSLISNVDILTIDYNGNSPRETKMTIGDLIKIIRKANISNYIFYTLRYLSFALGLIFAIVCEVARWTLDKPTIHINAGIVLYIISSFLIRFSLASFIFFYLGEAAVQLYSRFNQSKTFHYISSSSASKIHKLPHIKLDTLSNIRGWQMLRTTLLYEYQQPKIYVDVALSACFLLWLPLTTISALHIILEKQISMFLITSTSLSLLIFCYLAVCIHLAVKTRKGFDHIGLLHLEEYRLYSSSEDKQKEIKVLEKLREIIKYGQNDAIVFRICGIGINQNFSTLVLGIALSSLSTIFTRIFA